MHALKLDSTTVSACHCNVLLILLCWLHVPFLWGRTFSAGWGEYWGGVGLLCVTYQTQGNSSGADHWLVSLQCVCVGVHNIQLANFSNWIRYLCMCVVYRWLLLIFFLIEDFNSFYPLVEDPYMQVWIVVQVTNCFIVNSLYNLWYQNYFRIFISCYWMHILCFTAYVLYHFQGKIACANVLSDLYAMGVPDCDNMLMLLGVSEKLTKREKDVVTPLVIQGFNGRQYSLTLSV